MGIAWRLALSIAIVPPEWSVDSPFAWLRTGRGHVQRRVLGALVPERHGAQEQAQPLVEAPRWTLQPVALPVTRSEGATERQLAPRVCRGAPPASVTAQSQEATRMLAIPRTLEGAVGTVASPLGEGARLGKVVLREVVLTSVAAPWEGLPALVAAR